MRGDRKRFAMVTTSVEIIFDEEDMGMRELMSPAFVIGDDNVRARFTRRGQNDGVGCRQPCAGSHMSCFERNFDIQRQDSQIGEVEQIEFIIPHSCHIMGLGRRCQ